MHLLTPIHPPHPAPYPSAACPQAAYGRLFELAARCTAPDGLLALASCSSHMPAPLFGEVCLEAVAGGARRSGRVLAVQGQPADHPFPAACPELQYLKFDLYQLD
eukprot:364319-Chlamydomonas_euryale.AAC.17